MTTNRNDHVDLGSLMGYPECGRSDPARRVAMRRAIAEDTIATTKSEERPIDPLDLDDMTRLLDMLGLNSREQHAADLAHIGQAA